MANEVTIELKVDRSQFKSGLNKAEATAKISGKKISSNLAGGITRGLGRALGSMKTQLLALGGIFATVFAGRKILDAAAKQEDAVNALNSSLIATGKYSEATSKSMQDFASSLQKASRYGDEFVLENMALIQSLGNLEGKALKSATQAAADMSAALGIDLRAAATLVGKAAAGEVSSFSRYGLIIKKGATNAETFAGALKAINAQFGGAAARDVLTFSGAIDKAQNSFGDLLEQIGFLITKSPVVAAIVAEIGKIINEASDKIKGFAANREGVDSFIVSIITMGNVVVNNIIRPFEVAIRTVTALFNLVKTGAAAIAQIALEQLNLYAKAADFLGLGGSVTETIHSFVADTRKTFIGMTEDTADSFASILDTDISDSANNFLNRLETVAVAAAQKGEEIGKKFGKGVAKGVKDGKEDDIDPALEDLEKAMTKTIQGGLVNVLSVGMETVGKALVQGSSAFDNFGNVVIGLLADLAGQIGRLLVSMGMGIIALDIGLKTFNGYAVAAAGAALIVLSGALKALSGGGGTTVSPGPGASIPSATPGVGIETESSESVSESIQDQKTAPTVTVNVQGNILDRKQTGLEIVQIINDAIGLQDARILGNV